MEPKEHLKQITDAAIGAGITTIVEATLQPREYYVYTDAWTITAEQLDRIRKQVQVTALTVDGGRLMLTVTL